MSDVISLAQKFMKLDEAELDAWRSRHPREATSVREEALNDLINEYLKSEGVDAIISAMELQTMALEENEGED